MRSCRGLQLYLAGAAAAPVALSMLLGQIGRLLKHIGDPEEQRIQLGSLKCRHETRLFQRSGQLRCAELWVRRCFCSLVSRFDRDRIGRAERPSAHRSICGSAQWTIGPVVHACCFSQPASGYAPSRSELAPLQPRPVDGRRGASFPPRGIVAGNVGGVAPSGRAKRQAEATRLCTR